MADLICHSEDTAKRSYFFQEKKTKNTLRSVLREDGKATRDENDEKDVIMGCFKDFMILREKKSQ